MREEHSCNGRGYWLPLHGQETVHTADAGQDTDRAAEPEDRLQTGGFHDHAGCNRADNHTETEGHFEEGHQSIHDIMPVGELYGHGHEGRHVQTDGGADEQVQDEELPKGGAERDAKEKQGGPKPAMEAHPRPACAVGHAPEQGLQQGGHHDRQGNQDSDSAPRQPQYAVAVQGQKSPVHPQPDNGAEAEEKHGKNRVGP